MMAMFYGAQPHGAGAGGPSRDRGERLLRRRLTNCLEPEDIVAEIEFPIPQHDGWAFEEVARRFGDFALASIAVSIKRGRSGLDDARVAVMGVADTPLRLGGVEQQATRNRGRRPHAGSFSPNGDVKRHSQRRPPCLR